MTEEFSREQLWKLYEKLPPELREAIFSEETANNIWDICIRNGIEDNRISEIAKYVGRVLLGVLPPVEFQKILEEKIKLGLEKSKKIFHEINRLIFSPVKYSLSELYETEIAGVAPPSEIEKPPQKKIPKSDVYREPIE